MRLPTSSVNSLLGLGGEESLAAVERLRNLRFETNTMLAAEGYSHA
jgi:hypothetical protein